jgi:hypothetical protein
LGDSLVVDFKGYIDGQPFGGGEAAIGMDEPPLPPNAGNPPELPIVPEEPPA